MIIGFAGKAQSGKTTAAKFLEEQHGFRIVSYASGVKEECVQFLERYGVGFNMSNFYGSNAAKSTPLTFKDCAKAVSDIPEFLGFVHAHSKDNLSNRSFQFTPRALMQWWGTEYRRGQDPDYWVNRAMDRAALLDAEGFDVAIDDVRFPSEVEAIQESDGFVAYIVRHERPVVAGSDHPSETALDGYVGFDRYIVNDYTLAEYEQKIIGWSDYLLTQTVPYA